MSQFVKHTLRQDIITKLLSVNSVTKSTNIRPVDCELADSSVSTNMFSIEYCRRKLLFRDHICFGLKGSFVKDPSVVSQS